jgi:hypothetical protein
MLTALTRVKPLSLASPIVILAKHDELTLVIVTIKNPRWVLDGEGYEGFLEDVLDFCGGRTTSRCPCGMEFL